LIASLPAPAGWQDGEGTVSAMMRRIYLLAPAYARAMRAGGAAERPEVSREREAFGRIGTRVSGAEQVAICACWNRGERRLKSIADECGVSSPTVARVLAAAGLRERQGSRSGTAKHRPAILALIAQGKSADEITSAVGCSRNYIAHVLGKRT
jgi:hypothetical protein